MWTPSKILYLAAGLFAALAIAVGIVWVLEHEKGAGPTPTTAPDPFQARREAFVPDGCLPGVGQDAGATSWKTQYAADEDTSTCTFTLGDDVKPSTVSLVQADSGLSVIRVAKDGTGFITSYKASDLSTNNNGYFFNAENPEASHTSFMLPFRGGTVGVGFSRGSGSPSGVGVAYEDGDAGLYFKSGTTWSRNSSYSLPQLSDRQTDWSFFLVDFQTEGTDAFTYRVKLVTRESPSDSFFVSSGGKVTPFPYVDTMEVFFIGEDTSGAYPNTVDWGGSVVFLDESPDVATIESAALEWTKVYGTYQAPTLDEVVPSQTFYVGFEASDRNYAAPVATKAFPEEANDFRVDTTLPSGMSLDSATGLFMGPPEATYGDTMQMIMYNKVSTLSSEPKNILVTVAPAPTISYGAAPTFVVVKGQQADIPAPTVESLDGPIVLSSGTLPSGLTLHDDGSITGVATGDTGSVEITVTAQVPLGTSLATEPLITLDVQDAPPEPLELTVVYPDQVTWVYGTAQQPIVPTVTVDGEPASSVPDGTFQVTPNLPDGLVLDQENGVISGTPTIPAQSDTYRIQLTVPDRGQAYDLTQLTVHGVVEPPQKMQLDQYQDVDYTFTFEPEETNTWKVLAADINPELPKGLYADGKRVYGQVLDDSIREQTYKVRAALALPNGNEGEYIVSEGEFTLSVEPYDDGGELGRNQENAYLGSTIGLGVTAFILLVIGIADDVKRRRHSQKSA